MRSAMLGVLIVGAATLPGAAELLSSSATPDGYELSSDPGIELDFAAFAEQSPYSVGHVDAESADAAATTASLDVWALGDNDVLLREVAVWPSDDLASGFVGEVSAYAAEVGLEATRAPFDGASAFSGADPDSGVWVRMVVWSDGQIGATVNHFAAGADDDPGSGDVDATSNALAAQLAAANAAASPNDPLADGGGGGGSGTSTSSGGGIPIVTVIVWLAIIGGAIWLFLKLRRTVKGAKVDGKATEPARSEAADEDEDRDVDDIIERARARGRAQQEVDAIPDPTDEWTPPDDY